MVVLVQAAAPGQIKGLEVGSAPGQERERKRRKAVYFSQWLGLSRQLKIYSLSHGEEETNKSNSGWPSSSSSPLHSRFFITMGREREREEINKTARTRSIFHGRTTFRLLGSVEIN